MKIPPSLFTPPEGPKDFKQGFLLASGIFIFLSRLWIWVLLLTFLLLATGWFMDDSDSGRFSPSGLGIKTDAKMGVQYLYRSGVLTPRLNADGSLVIKPVEK